MDVYVVLYPSDWDSISRDGDMVFGVFKTLKEAKEEIAEMVKLTAIAEQWCEDEDELQDAIDDSIRRFRIEVCGLDDVAEVKS